MKTPKRTGRLFAALLCLILIVGLLPVSVFAAKDKFKNQDTVKLEPDKSSVISEVKLTGIDKPVHRGTGDTTLDTNDFRVSVGEVEWLNQSGSKMNGPFEYGKQYVLSFYLFVSNAYDFAKDTSHPLATPDKPMPAVTVTVDGIKATVLPDYGRNSFMRCLKASVLYTCDKKVTLNEVSLVLTEPAAGGYIDYEAGYNGSGYQSAAVNDDYNKNGIAWRVAGGSWLPAATRSFGPNEAYQAQVRLVAENGYEFAVDANGNSLLAARINSKTAEVKANRTEAILTYTFPKTGKLTRSAASVFGIDMPKVGMTPDYEPSTVDDSCVLADYSNATTKKGISWYCETDKKTIATNAKFEADKVYTVQITLWTTDKYEFAYSGGNVNVQGYINGEAAAVSSRDASEVTLSYTFPKTVEEKHVCSPLKVDEYKATCKEEGKKSYYYCPECGKSFEDSACTKEIADVNAWGVIAKLEHTGGKAACDNRAICKNCGERYGELAPHKFGTGWDYTDALGHARTCKVCGAPDTLQPHSGGTASCGEVAKCAECKAEYGEVMQHQWTDGWTYTDAKGHAHKCSLCGDHDTVQAHTGGTATCMEQAACAECGVKYGKTGEHVWSTGWDYKTAAGHAHLCTVSGCGAHDDVVKHTPGAAATETTEQLCTVCSFIIAPKISHVHETVKVDEVKATCTTAGRKAYYTCKSCDGIFENSSGSKVVSDPDSLIVPASGHKESKWKSDADIHWKECTVKGCGVVIEGTNLGHEFGKNDKCTICNYKREAAGTVAVTMETEQLLTPDDQTPPAQTTLTAPAVDQTVMWVIVGAAVAVAAVCMIVMTVVLVKKGKKE